MTDRASPRTAGGTRFRAEIPRGWTPLSAAERRIWHAVGTGRPIDLRPASARGGRGGLPPGVTGRAGGGAEPDWAQGWAGPAPRNGSESLTTAGNTAGPPPAERRGVPGADDDQVTVRAEVLAALLIGSARPITPASAVRISGARITGTLDLAHCRVDIPFAAVNCRFDEPLLLDHATLRSLDLRGSVLQPISAYNVTIDGTFDLRGVEVNGEGRRCLEARGLTAGDVLAGRARFTGWVDLIGARIGGQLSLHHAVLHRPGAECLNAGGISVVRDVLADHLVADGEVRLPGARIGGLLLLSGARLRGANGRALSADASSVGSDARLNNGFSAVGEVRFTGSRLDGDLRFDGAHIEPAEGRPALGLGGIQVRRSVFLSGGFTTTGEVRLTGAHVDGHLDLVGADWPQARLTLYGAHIASIRDLPDAWPAEVNLDGLIYGGWSHYLIPAKRLPLLRRQIHGHRPQPYQQLAAYYRSLGHDAHARTVLLANERSRRRTMRRSLRVLGYVLDGLVGYGYRPLRAVGWFVGLFIAATVYFAHVRPTQIDPQLHLQYNPVVYTAQTMVPLLTLAGGADDWQSRGVAGYLALAVTVLGWILGIAVVGAVTRTVTRN